MRFFRLRRCSVGNYDDDDDIDDDRDDDDDHDDADDNDDDNDDDDDDEYHDDTDHACPVKCSLVNESACHRVD